MNNYGSLLVVCATLYFSAGLHANDTSQNINQLPPWAQPELIRMVADIQLRDEQVTVFRQETAQFIEHFYAMVRKELRNNSGNKKRSIARRARKLAKKLDASMHRVLDDDQAPAYGKYRDELMARLNQQRSTDQELRSQNQILSAGSQH